MLVHAGVYPFEEYITKYINGNPFKNIWNNNDSEILIPQKLGNN